MKSSFRFSIKKKVKGGGQVSAPGNPNCKTLPNNCNSPGGGGGPVPHPHHSLKFSKTGALETAAPTDPISSAIVKYNYQAQQLDELSLVKGARIMILEKSGDGWWRGQCANKIGWFPSNYTQEELEETHTYCMAENILDIMVALYAFKAQNDTELSFDKAERLEILDRPPSDPDWYKARNNQGQIGLVPKNYLIELSQYLTQDVGNNKNGGLVNNAPVARIVPADDIKNAAWYFGQISRSECDTFLSEKGLDGDFMIRDSETNVSRIFVRDPFPLEILE